MDILSDHIDHKTIDEFANSHFWPGYAVLVWSKNLIIKFVQELNKFSNMSRSRANSFILFLKNYKILMIIHYIYIF